MMTVYADVLLTVNLFVNYMLLLCSAKIMRSYVPKLRLLAGAAVGSLYGLVIFLPELPKPVELALRTVATVFIVLCAYGFGNKSRFLRSLFTFFAVSMSFGGIMLVLWVTVAPVGMVYNNGAFYFDIDIVVLAVSTVVCFALVSLISFFTARRAPRGSSAAVTVTVGGHSVRLHALIDTGNSLRESFSGYPAAVTELSAVEKLLPDGVIAFLKGEAPDDDTSFRLIFHTTVSGGGVMPAFRPDSVRIKTLSGEIETDKIYIAVTPHVISKGEYSMILNPDLISEEKIYAKINS